MALIYQYQIHGGNPDAPTCPRCQAWDGVTSTRIEDLPPAPNPDCYSAGSCACSIEQIEVPDPPPDPDEYFPDGGGEGGGEGDTGGGSGPGGGGHCFYEYSTAVEGDPIVIVQYAYYDCSVGRIGGS